MQLQVFELREEVRARLRAEREAQARARLREEGGAGSTLTARGATAAFPPHVTAPGGGPVPPPAPMAARTAPAMGLGAGGRMRQEVYRDDRPAADWREKPSGRVFVHLSTVPQWREITGEPAPRSPVDRAAYNSAGLPWFDYYEEDAADLAPAEPLTGVKPVGDWLGDDEAPWVPTHPHQVKQLGDDPGQVTDGEW